MTGMDRTRLDLWPGVLLGAVLLASPLLAAEQSATDLAKQTQNPVADLISVPFQHNFNFNTGPENRTVWVMNVQPVIPITLGPHWNLITRTIMPIINQPSLAPGIDHAFGLGDINPTLFLSPVGSEKFIWGVGPTFTFPTATSKELGSGEWSAGQAAVALTMQGPWVAGILAQNQWSFAGWSDHDVNALLMQPFVNYNFGEGWYVVTAPILTADWTAPKGDQWTVPLGLGGGRLFRLRDLPGGDALGDLGKLPINTSLQAFYNAVTPSFAADWQQRFQVQFLFPK
jgi:hypothetical protein